MESICAIKDIYKALYQFEKTFAEVHDITINEAMVTLLPERRRNEIRRYDLRIYRSVQLTRFESDHSRRE